MTVEFEVDNVLMELKKFVCFFSEFGSEDDELDAERANFFEFSVFRWESTRAAAFRREFLDRLLRKSVVSWLVISRRMLEFEVGSDIVFFSYL